MRVSLYARGMSQGDVCSSSVHVRVLMHLCVRPKLGASPIRLVTVPPCAHVRVSLYPRRISHGDVCSSMSVHVRVLMRLCVFGIRCWADWRRCTHASRQLARVRCPPHARRPAARAHANETTRVLSIPPTRLREARPPVVECGGEGVCCKQHQHMRPLASTQRTFTSPGPWPLSKTYVIRLS